MAGVKGQSGRHKEAGARASANLEGLFLRLRSDVLKKVWSCKGKIEDREGVSLSKAEAVERIVLAGCAALERTREGREAPGQLPLSTISEISNISLSEIAALPDYGADVPGYGFPEDEEETLAPASPTNGTHAPAPTTQPAIPLALEPAPKTTLPGDVPQVSETPIATTPPPQLSEDVVKIAEARAQYDKLSEREFIQLLFDRGIYRHRAKDGSDMPLPHSTYRDWMKKAREAGLF